MDTPSASRSELFGAERLAAYAPQLAASHDVLPGRHRGRPLLARLRDNRAALLHAWTVIGAAARAGEPVTPAAEWLVDNFHVVEDQLREVVRDLPPGFYRELPKLARGEDRGLPRVHALVASFVEHTECRFDLEALRRFVLAYQDSRVLTLGELWAVAISMRLVLVERLRVTVDVVVRNRQARLDADQLADALLDPARAVRAHARLLALRAAPLAGPFVVQLLQRMRDRDPATTPGLVWLEARLTQEGRTAEDIVREEHLRQAALQGPVRDAITAMRALATVDWGDFVEGVSRVEQALHEATLELPSDFATRDMVRHAVEELARGSIHEELAVARFAVQKASGSGRPIGDRAADPAFYLIGGGRRSLESDLGFRPTPRLRLRRAVLAARSVGYLGTLWLTSLCLWAIPMLVAARAGTPVALLVLLGLLAIVPATELGTAALNHVVVRVVGPKRLPKLRLEDGVPAGLRTLVVVPALLATVDEVDELLERVEVHYLSNDDGELCFGLATDWCDAAAEMLDGDDALLEQARAGVQALNERHGPTPDGSSRFFLFHRGRRWNAGEGKWMGWERKRGKLHELNALLRGATDTTFETFGGAHDPRPAAWAALAFRYVITLDSDTLLPRGTAKKLVGAMAHPLNRPIHDPSTGCVVDGYGILQPRIKPTLPEVGRGTLLQRACAGPAGLDPYAFAVSDVYQDLFGEGSYCGKGIYDLDAFQKALAGRVPENVMLSHDLFEGLFARAGLVSELELFEHFPSSYAVIAARQHRWVRGDWQLLPWIVSRQPISVIGRWKMADNLRRTLVAPASLATLLVAWTASADTSGVWTGFILSVLTLPILVPMLLGAMPHKRGLAMRVWWTHTARETAFALLRAVMAVVFLAEHAVRMVDAIGRSVYRTTISRTSRLEWVTARQVARSCRDDLQGFVRAMWRPMAVGALSLGLVLLVPPRVSGMAAGLSLLWIGAPLLAFRISAAPRERPWASLDGQDTRALRLIARRTWRYFETFVTVAEHSLPPDNFQEDPHPVVARRTSPTNIGLYLLSAVSAHDMGWIGRVELVERIAATLATLELMERDHGHFFNWYDTSTLAPLHPRYISTVDSGNLAGHLLTLQQACLELAATAPSTSRAIEGVGDALWILREALAVVAADRRGGAVQASHVDDAADEVWSMLAGLKDAPDVWSALVARAEVLVDSAQALAEERNAPTYAEVELAARAVRDAIVSHARDADWPSQRIAHAAHLVSLAMVSARLCTDHDWRFVYHKKERLFAIGYNADDGVLDSVSYDLLASECRLASFLAVAHGAVPVSHWFRLGRRLTAIGGGSVLLSWSGSMFEYLMPELVMATPVDSLLGQSVRRVVRFQIRYGRDRHVPWGISEACYNVRDVDQTYQYANFGASGLGLRVGLGDDLVIAPYATALAAMVDPVSAVRNFAALVRAGARGRFGFYESVDYTAARLPDDTNHVVVKTYMAHHQGMSVVALCGVVADFPMRRRFHASATVDSAILLLHELSPRDVDVALRRLDDSVNRHVRVVVPPVLRQFSSPHNSVPATHRLSNGRYSVAISAAGSGGSSWNELAVTRWREDDTLDPWGSFIYVRDVDRGRVWSAGFQPAGVEASEYLASFYEHHVEIFRRDGSLSSTLDVVVASEDDAELRQLTLVNHGLRTRDLEITSYAEVVLAAQASDVAHPAFSNLFVQTEFDVGKEALLASRRPRSTTEPTLWAAHIAVVQGVASPGVQFETDRARFLGRGRNVRCASAACDGTPLSNTVGPVLDPIFSLRRRVRIEPGETVRVMFVTLVGASREHLIARCDAYLEVGAFERTLAQAWSYSQIQLRHLGIDAEAAQLYQRLGSRMRVLDPGMRASRDVIARNQLGQRALWRWGISGDRPILLARIRDPEDHDLVRQLVHAHCYLRLKGLALDLVLLNEFSHTYAHDRQDMLESLVRASHLAGLKNGVHILRAEHLTPDEIDLLLATARVVIDPRHGSLFDQVTRHLRQEPVPAPPTVPIPTTARVEIRPHRLDVELFNGIGGFADDGRVYAMSLGAHQWTPMPWINVVANPAFGFTISESGGGYTWAGNSFENQLTPWSNDPVCDPSGEVLYLMDEDTGELWTPTCLPIREDSPYVVRHGQGWTSFEHESRGIASKLTLFVMPDEPVKVSTLQLTNRSGRTRRISVTAFVEWSLGSARSASTPFVVTSRDAESGALFARNVWRSDVPTRTAFLHMSGVVSRWTADRTQFLGRNGSRAFPAGLRGGAPGSHRVGAALDPCAVLGTTLTLSPEGTAEVVVRLGQADTEDAARALLGLAVGAPPATTLDDVRARWDTRLSVVQVRTPDRQMDLLMNRWLVYQTLACRLWARTGLYQAGGAFGFRDQLQDVMALVLAEPALARAHIVRAAGRQFVQGDVQHWWHPPSGKGTRTRFSDDRLWLPHVVSYFLDVTGDETLLDEAVPFLDAPELKADEHESYQEPTTSAERVTVYEHAARAIDVSLRVGRHGLPLIGSGDWNDGMNRVGHLGEGESVWLAWFQIATLGPWVARAHARGDAQRADAWRAHIAALGTAVETEGWDGAWYRRAFMDDGTALGSASNLECRIDSIAQSWAVLSGAGRPERARAAMDALDEHLARELEGVLLLLTPPFDKTPTDPGYIKGYVPGIRENGGQYTHAAIWAVMAFAQLGNGNKAGELFAMINPINHARTRAGVHRYKVEPYVVAADVYGAPPHVGRGGWTWYTGSAAWMYRVGLESLLGVQVRGARLHLEPCVPETWPGFEVTLTLHGTRFLVRVLNPAGVQRGLTSLLSDGAWCDPGVADVPLRFDGGAHEIVATMGSVEGLQVS